MHNSGLFSSSNEETEKFMYLISCIFFATYLSSSHSLVIVCVCLRARVCVRQAKEKARGRTSRQNTRKLCGTLMTTRPHRLFWRKPCVGCWQRWVSSRHSNLGPAQPPSNPLIGQRIRGRQMNRISPGGLSCLCCHRHSTSITLTDFVKDPLKATH